MRLDSGSLSHPRTASELFEYVHSLNFLEKEFCATLKQLQYSVSSSKTPTQMLKVPREENQIECAASLTYYDQFKAL
eukprot:IDg8151t1